MFEFKLLDTFYDVNITLEYPDYRHTYYQCREHVIARYNKDKDMYSFRFDGRENILINNEPPVEIMDILMIETGNYLYPICFNVSPKGEIMQVENFGTIRENWHKNTRSLLDSHYTHPFERYLQIASRNLTDEPKFREAMVRNSLVKLLPKPLKSSSFMFVIDGFPSKGNVSMFHCTKKSYYKQSDIGLDYEAKLVFPTDAEGGGYIKYSLSKLIDIEDIDARFDLIDKNGQKFAKFISIKTDKKKRKTSHKISFWSRMIK